MKNLRLLGIAVAVGTIGFAQASYAAIDLTGFTIDTSSFDTVGLLVIGVAGAYYAFKKVRQALGA